MHRVIKAKKYQNKIKKNKKKQVKFQKLYAVLRRKIVNETTYNENAIQNRKDPIKKLGF